MPPYAVVPVPFLARVVGKHGKDIVARDRARAMKCLQMVGAHGPMVGKLNLMSTMSDESAGAVDVTDAGVTYTASVGVGSPATDFTLLIDTGE